MRLNKRCPQIRIHCHAQDAAQSYHNKSSLKQRIDKLGLQISNLYSQRCQHSQLCFQKPLNKQKTTRVLQTILRRGDSSRKIYFQQQQIPSFHRQLDCLRYSQADKATLSSSHKQNRKQLLRMSMSDKPKRIAKVSEKKERELNLNFNKLLKEIKQKNYIRIDDQNEKLKLKFEASGATLKGQSHAVNQDSMMFSEGIYIICDGHGANGKQISEFVSQTSYRFIKEAIGDDRMDMEILKQIMKKTQIQLDLSGIDIAFSGSTLIAIVIYQSLIFCISVGDSRAILNQGLNTKELGIIHKPDKKSEKDRIERCGGVIHPFQIGKDKYVGPNRIWAPGKTSWGPGLALSRAFGDKASRKYGVIAEAQILQYKICYDINFIVLGSDGLFDFMKEAQISFFIRKRLKDVMLSREQICEELVQEARKIYQAQSDDISCIIISF